MRACAPRSTPPPKRKPEEAAMSITVTRREFLKASAAAGGAFALELSIPGAALAQSPDVPEVTQWVVIYPDDRVVIRIARSEMGQGSLTGLAQLVAEELDCDWSKVTTEFASPNEHVRRRSEAHTSE